MDNLDPQVVALAKAIREHESGGNFQARGGSGEFGAYQFMPGTWAGSAQKYLGANIPVEKATPEQQNEVAYKKIKEWKDSGYNPAQIASLWNSGSPDWHGKVGTNSHGVHYDVPKYVDSVYSLYEKYKNGGGNNPVMHTAQAAGNGMAGTDQNTDFKPGQAVPGTGDTYPDFSSESSDLSPEDLQRLKQMSGPEGNLVGLAGGYGLMGQLAKKGYEGLTDVTGTKELGGGLAAGIVPLLPSFKQAQQAETDDFNSLMARKNQIRSMIKMGMKVPPDALAKIDNEFRNRANTQYEERNAGSKITTKQVLGGAAKMLGTILASGSYGGLAGEAASSGKLVNQIPQVAKVVSTIGEKGAPLVKAINPLSGGPVASIMKLLIGNKIINAVTGGKENLLGGLIKGLLD